VFTYSSAVAQLGTEATDPALDELDRRPTAEIVRAVVAGHDAVLAAVAAAEDDIARLADAAAERMHRGGRVIYAGAGSGGRIAQLDASEWGPTFSVPDGAIVALLAGAEHPPGSREEAAAEDDEAAGAAAVHALRPAPDDVLIAVSASGRTPYPLGALRAAARAGALTAAVTSAPGSPAAAEAALAVVVPVGPEPISGSTRLKAGTAQKLVLNAFSTAVMVRRGRTYGNLMAGFRVANDKLRGRAVRVVMLATDSTEEQARAALRAAGDDLAVAVVARARGTSVEEARRRLAASHGAIRAAIDSR
jgi:N-acetylmuramic acid 6-phosphate etherase